MRAQHGVGHGVDAEPPSCARRRACPSGPERYSATRHRVRPRTPRSASSLQTTRRHRSSNRRHASPPALPTADITPPIQALRARFTRVRAAIDNGTLERDHAVAERDGPAVRTGERRDGPQVLDGLYCRASAAAVPSHDPHDLNLAGWSAFPSADAARRADAVVPERPQARGGTPWPASATSP